MSSESASEQPEVDLSENDDFDKSDEDMDNSTNDDIPSSARKGKSKKKVVLEPPIPVDDEKFERMHLSKKLSQDQIICVIKFRYVMHIRQWLIEWQQDQSKVSTNWFVVDDLSNNARKLLTKYLRSPRAVQQQGWTQELPPVTPNLEDWNRLVGPLARPQSVTALEAFELFFPSKLKYKYSAN